MEKKTDYKKIIYDIALCIFSLFGAIFLPSLFSMIFASFGLSELLSSTFGEVLYIFILIALFYNSLRKEFNTFKKNFKKSFKTGFKYYLIGYMAMIFFNLIITFILKDISTNENEVRNLLLSSPVIAFINISILAPIAEELSFRKSMMGLFKNKYIFALLSGFLFGFAHLTINIMSGSFVLSDMLYVLPYGSLGFMFALMDFDTKSTFTSICMHAIHNSVTCILLLLMNLLGAL